MSITVEEVIKQLNLQKHPTEGGYFLETYRSDESIDDPRWGKRSLSTAIYYMLTNDAGVFSEMHRLAVDEVYHFYMGDPVELLLLHPDGTGERVIVGNRLEEGMVPQLTVKEGVWQGSRLLPEGIKCGFALMGTTVSPGFEYRDYESGGQAELTGKYAEFKELIAALTRKA
ncbi:MAG: cupin domain-containing protein [bacterium]|nr:cupin domain-containing protein [bacterium]